MRLPAMPRRAGWIARDPPPRGAGDVAGGPARATFLAMKYPTWALSALLACSACAAIPEVSFEDDAGADTTAAALDGAGLAVDASSDPDGSTGTPPADGGADTATATCPRTPPPGATTCCGAIPCVGGKCAQRCDECARCGPDAGDAGRVCCVPNSGGQQAVCADAPQRCPNNGGNGNGPGGG